MPLIHSFSSDYVEARRKLKDACADAGLECHAHVNPIAGPGGEELSTEVVRIGAAQPERIVFVVSGVHGPEGFAGAGCQTQWIQAGRHTEVPPGVAVVFVHALNCYGMASVRRQTEGNVDLNRNFVDFSTELPRNPEYSNIHPALVCDSHKGPARAAADELIDNYIEKHGKAAFHRALEKGQYEYEDGMYYGGQAPVWANQTARSIFAQYRQSVKHSLLIDVHTGFGPYSYGSLIVLPDVGNDASERARSCYGEGVIPASSSEPALPSDRPTGHLYNALEQSLPDATSTPLLVEFGTFDTGYGVEVERAEHWLHLHGDKSTAIGREIRAAYLHYWYPQTREWQEMVWYRFDQIMDRAIRYATSI